jgi:hypothetical protein
MLLRPFPADWALFRKVECTGRLPVAGKFRVVLECGEGPHIFLFYEGRGRNLETT